MKTTTILNQTVLVASGRAHIVDADGHVSHYDSVAGCFCVTRGLTPRQSTRIANACRKAGAVR